MSDLESGIEPVQRSDPVVESARDFLASVPEWLDTWHTGHAVWACKGRPTLSYGGTRPAFGETREESLQDWERELMNAVAMEAANRGLVRLR